MWNKSIKLPARVEITMDEDGFQTESVSFVEHIPANFMDVTRNDEILANQKGYTASQIIEIMECNYNGEKYLVDEATGEVYDVRRTFGKDKSMMIQLIGERRQRNGGT